MAPTNPPFQKLNILKLKDIFKLKIAKTMFCFNKRLAKNESQTIISMSQNHIKKRDWQPNKIIFNLERQQNYVEGHFVTLDLKYGKKYPQIKVTFLLSIF